MINSRKRISLLYIEFTLVRFWQPIRVLVRPAENLELEEEDE